MLNCFIYILNFILADKNTANFIKFNNNIFKKNKLNKKSKILVEFHNWHPLHIAFSIVANYLSKINSSSIIAYPGYINISQNLEQNFLGKIKWYLGFKLSIKNFGVYKSFGTEKILFPSISEEIKTLGEKKAILIFKKIKNKKQILSISVNGVLIGDLIYDTYLKKFKSDTIDLQHPNFFQFFKNTIVLYYFWLDYFKKNRVSSVIISHAVYTLAIPARIAMKNKIKVFIPNHSSIYNLTNKHKLSFLEFKFFKKKFSKLNKDLRTKGIEISKKRIKDRFNGKVGVDMWYSKASSFKKITNNKKVLNKTKKLKVLIATHCLFDSPHVSGNFFFNDFSDWLHYLGNLSNKTNYEWYLKAHPYFIKESYNKIKKIIKKYKKINIIEPNTSHHKLISEGINVVLTCMGTIGFEYALFNKTVVNASTNNPHYNYNFNINPKNFFEYDKILNNLTKYKKIKINKNKIFEYYFMMHIYHPKNWIFKNIEAVEKKCGSYSQMYSSKIYECFQDEYSRENFNKINKVFENFYKSNNFKLDYKNLSLSLNKYLNQF